MQAAHRTSGVGTQTRTDAECIQRKLLNQMTEMVLLLNILYDCVEKQSIQTLDDRIYQITDKINRAYDEALAHGISLNTSYLTQSSDGNAYSLSLTVEGLECRLVS